MGRFLNPDNHAFQIALNSKIYVDKTGLLDITNQSIDTDAAFVCNSRPRRFGKSITANMLAAYYSKSCDSRDMFENLKIGGMDSFEQYLNQYDVIHFDVQWCMMDAGGPENTVSYLNEHLINELKTAYPSVSLDPACFWLGSAMTRRIKRTNVPLKCIKSAKNNFPMFFLCVK